MLKSPTYFRTENNTFMKRTFWCLLVCLPLFANSQHTEVGIFAGVNSYSGDISKHFDIAELKEAYGGFVRYNFNDYVGLRLGINGGRMSGDDAHASPSEEWYEYRLERNLSFTSSLVEGSLVAEVNLFGYQPYNLQKVISPYIFGGVSFFHFNPKAEYNNEWVALQPLGTEGQGMDGFAAPYKRTSFAIPFGGGLKYAVNDLWNIGIEVGLRKTFTDYIDDVSTDYVSRNELIAGNGELAANLANRTGEYLGTEPVSVPTGTTRGNPLVDDWFTLMGITVSYNFLDNGLVGWRKNNRRNRNGCPTNF